MQEEQLYKRLTAAAASGDSSLLRTVLAAGAEGDVGRCVEGCSDVDTHWVDEELMWVDEAGGACPAAMMWAVKYGHLDCLKFLYPVGCMPGNAEWLGNVLAYAAVCGSIESLEWLLSPAADAGYTALQLDSALRIAAEKGDAPSVKLLLEAGADVADDEEWADICENLEDGGENADCLSLLRAAETVPKHVLVQAAQRGDAEEVRRCLLSGADALAACRALFPAAAGGHTECVTLLLEAGADVNVKSELCHTCLMLAAEGGHAECVHLLLDAGADVNAVAEDGMSSLLLASAAGHAECVKLLIEAGADVHLEDYSGCSIVMRAAEKGHMECLKLLFAAGASTRGLASVLLCQPSEFSGENG